MSAASVKFRGMLNRSGHIRKQIYIPVADITGGRDYCGVCCNSADC